MCAPCSTRPAPSSRCCSRCSRAARCRRCSPPSHPASVRALAMMTPLSRVVRGPGYEWAQTVEERASLIDADARALGQRLAGESLGLGDGDPADERGRRASRGCSATR